LQGADAAYGGYYAVYLLQTQQIAATSAAIRASNPGQVLFFDRARHSWVMKNPEEVVNYHELPVAYEPDPQWPEGYRSSRLVRRDQCPMRRDTESRIYTSVIHFENKIQTQVRRE
jgi:hypothetical protein